MRTMKDRERFLLVVKVFLDLNGPATSKDILEYIKKCPVGFQREFNLIKISVLLRGQKWIKKDKQKGKKEWIYSIKKEV